MTRVIEDSPRGWRGGGRVVRVEGRFRFVREEKEEEKRYHCLESLNARNRTFKRVERTNDGAKMQSRLLESGSRFDILFKCGYEVELGSSVILLRG